MSTMPIYPRSDGEGSLGLPNRKWRDIYADNLHGDLDGKLKTSRTVDGIAFDGSKNVNRFVVCHTDSGIASKTAELEGFVLDVGSRITIVFTAANSADNPTLNVSDTGEAEIYYAGASAAALLAANVLYELVYDGAHWQISGGIYIPDEGSVDNNRRDYGYSQITKLNIAQMRTLEIPTAEDDSFARPPVEVLKLRDDGISETITACSFNNGDKSDFSDNDFIAFSGGAMHPKTRYEIEMTEPEVLGAGYVSSTVPINPSIYKTVSGVEIV